MAQEQHIVKVVINKQSVFKIKDFYDFFYDLITSIGFDVFEDVFVKKAGDTNFQWSCLKWVDDYLKYKIWINTKIIGAKSVKVKKEGFPEVMDKAEVHITIKGKLITDWQDRWGTNPLTKFFKGIFDKYLLGPTLGDRKKELLEKVYLVENELKSFFDLPRFM